VLSGFERKVERAREHLNSIKAEEALWIDGQSQFITVEPDQEPRPVVDGEGLAQFALSVSEVVPVSPHFPMLIGDCVHNLRSALDHLATELVVAEGNVPDERTAFPIWEDRLIERKGKTAERNLWISGGVDLRALAVIEEAQPYHRVEDPTAHPLWVLRELSNMDKHRLPILVGESSAQTRIWIGLGSGGSGGVGEDGRLRARPLERGANFGRVGVPISQFQSYPYVKGDVFPRIAFSEGEVCAFQPVADVLEELTETVLAVIETLLLYTFPVAFRPVGLAAEPKMSVSAIARSRALIEARGDVWPWKEGPLAVLPDTEWLAQSGIPPEFF